MEKLKSLDELSTILHTYHKNNKKIVLVHGFFDILHKGHVVLLKQAKEIGDYLVVGLDCDENAKILKGPSRPYNNFEARAYVLNAIIYVDYIFEIPSIEGQQDLNDFFVNIYKRVQPDVLASNLEAGHFGKVRIQQAKTLNIKFVNLGENYKLKTSDIIKLSEV